MWIPAHRSHAVNPEKRTCEPERGVESAETSTDDDNAREVRVRHPLLVIQIFSGSGGLSAVSQRYGILLGRELSNRVVVRAELSHLFLRIGDIRRFSLSV